MGSEQGSTVFRFDFGGLTVGQVASASSAAVGGGAVQVWMQNLIELARQSVRNKGGWRCRCWVLPNATRNDPGCREPVQRASRERRVPQPVGVFDFYVWQKGGCRSHWSPP